MVKAVHVTVFIIYDSSTAYDHLVAFWGGLGGDGPGSWAETNRISNYQHLPGLLAFGVWEYNVAQFA